MFAAERSVSATTSGTRFPLSRKIMYSERGQLTLAHTDATVRAFRQRAEVNKHFGGRTEMIDRQQIRELVPSLNLDPGHLPVLAGLAAHAGLR